MSWRFCSTSRSEALITPLPRRPRLEKARRHCRAFAQVELPGEIMSWLDRFDEVKRVSPATTAPKHSTDAMFHVLRRSREHVKAEIAPFRAYVKNDGGIGKSVQEIEGNRP